MPLPLPRLDDRDFDQLVDEARETLPLNAPAWTDHNASDPGITLIELFAYLTEIGLYRLDRVLPAERRAFLRLLGFPEARAQAAQTVVTFERGGAATGLPAGAHVSGLDGHIVFQTAASLAVSSAALVSVITSHAGELIDRTDANRVLREAFAPLGDTPLVDDALYLGFDRPLGLEGTLVRLHVFGADADRDRETLLALAAESRAVRRDVRATCPIAALRMVERYWEHYSARLSWEYHDLSGQWMPLAHAKDRTRALSISGPVHFRLPDPAAHAPGGVPGLAAPYFVRARLRAGEYDCAPVIRGVRINAVAARHAVDVATPESFDRFFGHAGQACSLVHAPVVPGSTRVEMALPRSVSEKWEHAPSLGAREALLRRAPSGSREIWTEVVNWDRSGPLDRHYVLQEESGVLVFGDGRQGRVPPAGATAAVTYRVGGGATGNVGAGTLTDAAGTGFTVSQPAAASGGAEAETISVAEGRAVRGLAQGRSVVTLQDFERLALEVPGVPVARAHAIANFHPVLSCLPAAGCVTVVIVPSCVDRRPEPSVALCRAVARYLDRRRPVACEVHVVGPRYTKVSVHAVLHLAAGADRAGTIERAREALEHFFHPLRGGASNWGWPVGRGVYRSEVLALLASVAGVAWVGDLELQEGDGISARCGNVSSCPHGLVLSGAHRIVVA